MTRTLIQGGTIVTATDYYVDVVNGDDGNTGLTTNDAFRTISHAMGSTTNSTATRVLVLPGTYSAATGEAFPIELGDRQLIGTEGSDETTMPHWLSILAQAHSILEVHTLDVREDVSQVPGCDAVDLVARYVERMMTQAESDS